MKLFSIKHIRNSITFFCLYNMTIRFRISIFKKVSHIIALGLFLNSLAGNTFEELTKKQPPQRNPNHTNFANFLIAKY